MSVARIVATAEIGNDQLGVAIERRPGPDAASRSGLLHFLAVVLVLGENKAPNLVALHPLCLHVPHVGVVKLRASGPGPFYKVSLWAGPRYNATGLPSPSRVLGHGAFVLLRRLQPSCGWETPQ